MADIESRLAGLAPALSADATGGDFADVLRRRNRNRVTRAASVTAVVLAMVGGSALAATSFDTDRDDTPGVTSTDTPEPSQTPGEEGTPTFAPDPKAAPAQAAAAAALALELRREARLAGAPLLIQDVVFINASAGIALGQRCDASLGCMNEVLRTSDGGAHWGQRQPLTPRIVAEYPWDFVAPDPANWQVSRLAAGDDGVLYAFGPGMFGAENVDARFTGGVGPGLVSMRGSAPPAGDSGLAATCGATSCRLEYDLIFPLAEGGWSDVITSTADGVDRVMDAELSGEYGLFALADKDGFAAMASVAGSDGMQFTTTKVPCPGSPSVSLSSDAKLSIWMLCSSLDGAKRLFHTTDGRRFSELPQPDATSDTEAIVATDGQLWRWSMTSLSSSRDGGKSWTAPSLPGWHPTAQTIRAFTATGSHAAALVESEGQYRVLATNDGRSWTSTQASGLR